MHRECGPGLLDRATAARIGVPRHVALDGSPWWYDVGTHEIVRSSDGQRWRVEDVPELERSACAMRAVDVAAVDRWVLEQAERGR